LKIQDTLIVVLSDMHSGGSTALFPNREWQDEHQNHRPNERQKHIYKVYERCLQYVAEKRRGKRLIVVHNGDAIEGLHHNSIQVCVTSKASQAEIHTELMDLFLRKAKFEKKTGDRLFYVRGTETHVEDIENEIAKDLPAEKAPDGNHVFDHLELEINGRLIWLVHHGKKRGAGANEGNAVRNWLRDIYWDCKKSGLHPPDLLISGHTHTPTWNAYIARDKSNFHMIHGVVCPSWQAKTRFAYKVAPVEVNEVGAVFIEIKADGEIKQPHFILQDSKIYEAVKV
jgi:predicted phosphodiesterase